MVNANGIVTEKSKEIAEVFNFCSVWNIIIFDTIFRMLIAELMVILRQFDESSKGSDGVPAGILIRHFDVLGEVLSSI